MICNTYILSNLNIFCHTKWKLLNEDLYIGLHRIQKVFLLHLFNKLFSRHICWNPQRMHVLSAHLDCSTYNHIRETIQCSVFVQGKNHGYYGSKPHNSTSRWWHVPSERYCWVIGWLIDSISKCADKTKDIFYLDMFGYSLFCGSRFAKCGITMTHANNSKHLFKETPCAILTLKVLVATIHAQWEGMGDVWSARYEPALLPHARS